MAPKTKDKKEAIEDVYLDAVMGNMLDHYENTSYNLKLYMIGEEEWLRGQHAAEPGRTVVIAQTGVTGVQIDNLVIDLVGSPKTGNALAIKTSFQLFQPSAADLLDQIQAAKLALGHKYMWADVPLFLAIEFKGYEANVSDDIDDQGTPVQSFDSVLNPIGGPFIYKLNIAEVSVAIDSTGSTYDFVCPTGSQVAYTDEYFKLPKDLKVSGNDILDLAQDLQDQLKKYREDNLKAEGIHDEIIFDMSQIKEALGDTSTGRAGTSAAEEVNRLINSQEKGVKTLDEYKKALEEDPESFDGGIEAGTDWLFNQNINMKEGTDLNQFFTTLLVMCDSFLDKTTRKKVFDEPAVNADGFDLAQTFTKWYKIEASISHELDETGAAVFDTKRNKYPKKVIFKPVIYDRADVEIAATESNLNEEQTTKRVKEMNIKKAYNYLYTGLNDQILSADIKYDAGQLLLAVPNGGTMGDMSTNANSPTTNQDANTDSDGTDRDAEIAAKVQDPAGIMAALDDDDAFAQRIQDKLGLTSDEFKDIMKDDARKNDLAETVLYVNNRGSDPLGYRKTQQGQADFPVDSSTANTSVEPYKPEASGYLYSADLLSDYGGSTTVIGELSGYQALQKLKNSAGKTSKELGTEPKSKYNYGKSVVATSNQTNDGTPSATLFGYMYQNVNDAGILIDLNLKLRGDPWYLGKAMTYAEARNMRNPGNVGAVEEEQKSTDEYMVIGGSDNYFLFTMQTPRVRDPNLFDEDENTGYMLKQGTAFFISGVYAIMALQASFSGGLFEVEMTRAPKVTSLSLSKIDLTGN
tara:strand:+ start:8489 stop:10900 length:2412 start_codon:yes stop_codon:yes gene_type:complete